MTTTIPEQFLQVLAHPQERSLLLLLAKQREPIRYSEARRQLEFDPMTFQRALESLEDSGLVLTRAPATRPKEPSGKRRNVVFLELSDLGRFLSAYWPSINREFEKMAKASNMEEVLLMEE